ncbi:MAG: type I-C CRISPR-associated protein Cas7/Csd2 [Flexilinea sp.]|nr:type I-C CRISPR-associated protein Cas7/Csd2 [Flexilinea sp.]
MITVEEKLEKRTVLKNKIDFVALVNVTNANPNGDPLNGNRPRTDYENYGEMSDVCIKRKLRNRLQDLGYKILVVSDERCNDGFTCIKDRADDALGKPGKGAAAEKEFREKACEVFFDVRAFGQVFAYPKDNKNKGKSGDSEDGNGVSIGIRGPVSINIAKSVAPVEIESMQITKSTVTDDKADNARAETMGMKHFVQHGLYVIKGSISPQLAQLTGFTEEDADVLKECLRTLFVNDASAARPDGSMEVKTVYWWKHNCKEGQYSAAQVHSSVVPTVKNPDENPKSFGDYELLYTKLDGLEPEVIQGI